MPLINFVLVHGMWFDASSWSKVISILQNVGHRVIAVHLSLYSLTDDVATVKRAIGLLGGVPGNVVYCSLAGLLSKRFSSTLVDDNITQLLGCCFSV